MHVGWPAPGCTAHDLPTTNVRDDFHRCHCQSRHTIAIGKTLQGTQPRPHNILLMASCAAVVPNGLCSEAVALIGEVVAVRWYFLRDKAQVLYPTADVCGKGTKDLSRQQQSKYMRFNVQISIALCDLYWIEDRSPAL